MGFSDYLSLLGIIPERSTFFFAEKSKTPVIQSEIRA